MMMDELVTCLHGCRLERRLDANKAINLLLCEGILSHGRYVCICDEIGQGDLLIRYLLR